MEIFHTSEEMQGWSRRQAVLGKTIGLVPTMGYLHEGHLRLARMAREQTDMVVMSHFVNPTQFGPLEDLDCYPRDFNRDMLLAEQEKVDAIFAPSVEAMYSADFQSMVSVQRLPQYLCGKSRPGHFDGVATVVAKLFNIVRPDVAVFGEKDFQQLAIIRRMVADLNFPIRILSHPIVREEDGLAMSSRNANLNPENRAAALSLYGALQLTREQFRQGENAALVLQNMARNYIESFAGTAVDYICFVHETSLEPVAVVDEHTVLALAVQIDGKVRLIDNGYLVIPHAS